MLAQPDLVARRPRATTARLALRRPNWSWGFGVGCLAVYAVVGWWLLSVRHFAINDALARTLTAKIMVLSRDPHLASMGYYWMPLPTLVRIPFVLVLQPFGQAVLAGPAAAGTFAALTLPVLHAIGRAVDAPRWLTAVVVVGYGLSPVTVFSAASGMSETTFGFFLALSMLGYVRWALHRRSGDLAFLGWALAGAMLSRFETLVFVPVVAAGIAWTAPRGRRVPAAVLATLPSGIIFVLFSLTSKMIKNDTLYWWHVAKQMTATPDHASWLPADRSAVPLLLYGAGLLAAIAPTAWCAITAGVLDVRRKREAATVLAFVLVLPAAVGVQTVSGTSWAIPRFYVLTPLLAAAASLWFARAYTDEEATITPRAARSVGIIGGLLVPVAALSGTLYLADTERAGGEGEFVLMQPLLGRVDPSDPVDGTGSTPPPATLAWLDDYRTLAADLDEHLARGSTVAMDSKNGYSLIFSRHPKQYIVPEDRDYERIMLDPVGRVDFIITMPGSATYESAVLNNAISTSSIDGRWQEVRDYNGHLKLYQWMPPASEQVVGGSP